MLESEAIQLVTQALWLVLILSAPPIAVASLVGLLVALVQAVTQVQEQTFQFALKLVAVVLTLFATASLLGGTLLQYANQIMSDFPGMVRR